MAWVRERGLIAVRARQSDWRGWTVRDALRLARVEDLARQRSLARSAPAHERQCDGRPTSPPEPAAPSGPVAAPNPSPSAPTPLTQGSEH